MTTTAPTSPAKRLILKVDGMTCGHCEATVTGGIKQIPGVLSADASAAAGQVTIAYEGSPRVDEYRKAVTALGYKPVGELDSSSISRREERRAALELKLLAWSVLWTIPVLVLHYGGFMHETWALWTAFACATILQPTSAITYYRAAIASLRRRMSNMDVLVSIGIAAGYLYATLTAFFPATFDPHSSMEFFEAATLLICFIRFGKWIEARSRSNAASAMDALLSLTPTRARKLNADGSVQEVSIDEVKPGDKLVVLPGDSFPVDGFVKAGESSANEALISGESMPVPKSYGDRVIAGSTNGAGKLTITVAGVGANTAIAKIVQLVEAAQASRAPAQRMADRISNVFVPLVVLIAVGSGVYWGGFTDVAFSRVLTHVIGVLVIACPCALGIAVPAAIMIGSGSSLRKGILVKDGGALEKLSKLDRIVFDKTGTLTSGAPKLSAAFVADDVDEREALATLLRLASDSTHPLSRAAIEHVNGRGIAPANIEGRTEETSGMGTILRSDARVYIFGSAALLEREGVKIDALAAKTDAERSKGASISYLAHDGRVLGAFAFRDPMRPKAKELVARIHAAGIRTAMISGDHEAAARAIAAEAGVNDVIAQAKPEDKIAAIKRWQAEGESVGMVGDGVNDAPALAQADVSIAIGGGSDVASETGSIVLMSGGVGRLGTAIDISRRVRSGIKVNLFASLIYNAVGIPLAAGLGTLISPGLVIPAGFAALAMVLSDASVALGSLHLASRLRKL
ncbi:MAG: cation-translocating P-type ATPase [Planctomycetes bacterium]|nr:cation-translocating P-type ATPase [Planctomycetota bacterium]NUQ33342.1 cation-translocating P-type ATPase [Planctomycetaceae bacterium]